MAGVARTNTGVYVGNFTYDNYLQAVRMLFLNLTGRLV
jgi:hypothetical protein